MCDCNDTGYGDGSVRGLRSGWITADHNALTVVESGEAAGPNSRQLLLRVSSVPLLRAPVSHHRISVQNFDPSLSTVLGHTQVDHRGWMEYDAQCAAQMMQRWVLPPDPS